LRRYGQASGRSDYIESEGSCYESGYAGRFPFMIALPLDGNVLERCFQYRPSGWEDHAATGWKEPPSYTDGEGQFRKMTL
jgi:hypothetical protein